MIVWLFSVCVKIVHVFSGDSVGCSGKLISTITGSHELPVCQIQNDVLVKIIPSCVFRNYV